MLSVLETPRDGCPRSCRYPLERVHAVGARTACDMITDELIWQILTAAAATAGLKKNLSPHWLRHAPVMRR
jgi:hypothetical protein